MSAIAIDLRREGRGEEFVCQRQEDGDDGNGEREGSAVPEPVEPVPELRREHVRLAAVDLEFPKIFLRVLEFETRLLERRGIDEIDHDRAGKPDRQDCARDEANTSLPSENGAAREGLRSASC